MVVFASAVDFESAAVGNRCFADNVEMMAVKEELSKITVVWLHLFHQNLWLFDQELYILGLLVFSS